MRGTWKAEAWRVINEVHATLAADISFKDRKKAIFDAYPFSIRKYHPYKEWCKAQREYLERYKEGMPGSLPWPKSPLERQKAKAEWYKKHGKKRTT